MVVEFVNAREDADRIKFFSKLVCCSQTPQFPPPQKLTAPTMMTLSIFRKSFAIG